MSMRFTTHLNDQLTALEQAGLFKTERAIAGPQSGRVALSDASTRINLCANNYLGLSNDAQVVNAAHAALDRAGYGMSVTWVIIFHFLILGKTKLQVKLLVDRSTLVYC